jgi:hypothetical protein
MSQAPKRIARWLSLLGAPIVAAAAILLGAAAVEWIVDGIAGLTSTDGLTRILSPVIIASALFTAAFALAGLAGSWLTVRSRGRRQIAAPIAGVLATMGAGLLYVQGPAIDQMLPAFAFALAVLGTGVAAGGWLLGWTSEHLPPSATALRSLGVAGAVGVAALPLATGVLMAFSAAEDAGAAIPGPERARLLRVARSLWDSPLQRLTYLDLAVTMERQSVRCGTSYTVEAFTLFGLRLDRLAVDACGISLPLIRSVTDTDKVPTSRSRAQTARHGINGWEWWPNLTVA